MDETATPATAAMTASETPAIQRSQSKYGSDNDYYDDPYNDIVVGSDPGTVEPTYCV
jgi:hypothetical protein